MTHSHGAGSIVVQSPRPLDDAIQLLSKRYGAFIDYEDPPYAVEETRDTTDPRWRANHPTAMGVMSVAGTSFSTTFQERFDRRDQLDLNSVLPPIVEAYNQSGNPGEFRIVYVGPNQYSVVGIPRGNSPPILDTKITLQPMDGTVEDRLNAIFAEIAKSTGSSTVIGSCGLSLTMETSVQPNLADIPARQAIRELFDSTGRPMLRWISLYDPTHQKYHFNCEGVVSRIEGEPGRWPE